tara:strand:- start:54 stop:155 length:102 start_codon:yes stop_codon:yes gene_type:complete
MEFDSKIAGEHPTNKSKEDVNIILLLIWERLLL